MSMQQWLLCLLGIKDDGPLVLDLGTEYGHTGESIRGFLPSSHIVGVEVHEPTLQACREDRGHVYNNLVLCDALKFLRKTERKWDAIIAAELIEHLTKEDGKRLCTLVTKRSKAAILTSPIGFAPQGQIENNPHQEHISGWVPEELEKLGFKSFAQVYFGYTLGVYYWSEKPI